MDGFYLDLGSTSHFAHLPTSGCFDTSSKSAWFGRRAWEKDQTTLLRFWLCLRRLSHTTRWCAGNETWLWLRKAVPKWNHGKWKHGPKPAVVPLLFDFEARRHRMTPANHPSQRTSKTKRSRIVEVVNAACRFLHSKNPRLAYNLNPLAGAQSGITLAGFGNEPNK